MKVFIEIQVPGIPEVFAFLYLIVKITTLS